MKSLYIGYRSIIRPIAVLAFNSLISGPKCWLGHSSISTGFPEAVLYTVLGAIGIIHCAQLTRAYMVYLLYCVITNPYWCQLCSIPIWAYMANPSGERMSNRSYISIVYSLYTPFRYSYGTQLFTTRAHFCNHWLAHCMPSTVPLTFLFNTYASHNVLMFKVQPPAGLATWNSSTGLIVLFRLFSTYFKSILYWYKWCRFWKPSIRRDQPYTHLGNPFSMSEDIPHTVWGLTP